MKLLQVFESFLLGRPIVEIGSENWFAAGCTVWQRNWFAAGCIFGSKNYFPAGAQFQQRMLIRCRQLNFSSDSPFHCRAQNSAVNVNSLQTIQFRQ